MQSVISVKGARENNLKGVDVDIPRDKLVIVTGLSGSGKSSLAFETIYAEGQRRFLESLSAWAKRFVEQLKKPKVDVVNGLSPVISIEQKSISKNPRSTIGTMTDLFDYMRILFATVGDAHCPYCQTPISVRTPNQIVEHLLSFPPGTLVEIAAPVVKIYGEDYPYLFADIRGKGYRRVRVNDELEDISEDLDLHEGMAYEIEAVIDRFLVKPDIDKQVLTAVQHGLRIGEGFLRFRVLDSPNAAPTEKTAKARRPTGTARSSGGARGAFGCPEHNLIMGEMHPYYFSFNEVDSACLTCSGLGVYLKVHPDLLVPDKTRSVKGGAFISEAFKYDKNAWMTRLMHSMAEHYCFSLDTPFQDLTPNVIDLIFYGTKGERFLLTLPEGATKGDPHVGKPFRFDGIINNIERRYRRYRKEKVAHTWMEEYLKRVMVERDCPDCQGTKLKPQRLGVTVNGATIHALQELNLSELRDFLTTMPPPNRQRQAGEQVVAEIVARLDLLLGIGLDYLNLSRRAGTLSGGESQRIRLSTQIGSGLMGMLYVLDEPSIGLHPKDNIKMINTLRRLRDIGNSVIVVEHDEETMRAADHILEIGPGPGIHGGEIVAQGTIADILANPHSLTGQYLSGAKQIRRTAPPRSITGKTLTIRGARHNNLKSIDVAIPLGVLVCITGTSGSGKSTLVNQILYKKLFNLFHDSRVLSGDHDSLEGVEFLTDVISIDQSPIGRTPTSNPVTYIGVYDYIRRLFAETPEAKARGYTASRFSFNVKGGRCEECGGQGIVTTTLQFMPDVETLCQTCKGARYNEETLEVRYRDKTIAEVLDLSIEEAVAFFAQQSLIKHKLDVLNQLGLGYLKLGQSSTTLSGGEAQRVKLAHELGKIKRGGRNLYILDEPTTGLHLADIQRLLDSLNRLVDAGNTVVVIEHHLDVIKTADYIIDLGPDGGHRGGEIVAQGTPQEVAAVATSYTGQFLKPLLI